MRALDRKTYRDLFQMKGQALAISLVIACGVATFVMSLNTLRSLERTQQTYYDRYRFAHVFASLKRAPNVLAPRIAGIPGVAQVQTRVVVDVNLDVEDLPEPAIGRLISIAEHPRPGLNDLHLRRGRYIEPGRSGEVLVSEAFAEAHALQLGDRVVAIIDNRRQDLTMVGVALSPEYILQIREGDLLPDDRRFGVFWMGRSELAAAYNLEGAFNSVAVTLMPGASQPEVIARLDDLLGPYGGVGAYGRMDQISHRYVSDEIQQLRSMALVAPVIFLSVAAFLLNVVLSRLVRTQREQIAALKAFGYTNWEIGQHYLRLVLLITLAGVLLGTLFGMWLGRHLTELYTRFYRFPVFEFQLDLGVVVWGLLVSVGAALLGTWVAVRGAVRLPPAEAMRPETPATYRPTLVERSGLQNLLPPATRMILRELERRPLKVLLSCLGIAMAVAVLVLGSYMEDAMNYLIEFQFSKVQRHDLQVTFVEPHSARVQHELQRLPGVMYAEPFRTVPVRLRSEHRARRVAIMGLPADGRLQRLLDVDERLVPLPPQGLLLSSKLAELLEVELGDELTVEVLEGARPTVPLAVTGLVTDFAGLNAYMDIRAVHRLMREGAPLSGALLAIDRQHEDALYAALKRSPGVAGVTVKEAALQSFRDTVAENLLRMRMFNIFFASVIAFGVVYNNARISLSERSRDLATLRVMGFTRAEISVIFLGELAVLTLLAIPLGLVLGYGFAGLATWSLDTELYRIPLVVSPATFGFATTVVLVATVISSLIVRRKLDHLDLVAVLKSRE